MSQSTLDHEPGGPTPPDQGRLETLERDFDDYRAKRDVWTMLVLGLAFFVMFASIIAVGFALRAAADDDAAIATDGGTITGTLSEYAIDLSASAIGPNGHLTVTNTGTMAHTVGIRDTDIMSAAIEPGGSTTIDLADLDAGTYEVFCDIAGHVEAGMSTSLEIDDGLTAGEAADPAGAMDMTAAEHAAMTPEEGAVMDQAMIESVMAFPAETVGVGNEALVPSVLPDGTKHFELTTSIVDWEVSPGKIVQAWAYNGIVPGPRIDLDVGDRVEVEITNDLPIGTDIHWHGIDVPNDQDGVAPITQDLVRSGETYMYRFTVTEPAIGMYHAHAHGDKSIPNGLFGTMYVGDVPAPAGQTVSGIEIPADLTIAQDIPMVVNDAGVIGLSLNGKSFPATAPIVATQGDWITVTYFNEGMQVHPMHLHGFEQIVYAKDGEPLDHPYAADTILVGPGERYTVLFHADQAGTWVWHCHILNHVESDAGMFGMVTAVVVQ
ncbi:MAG: multicopper oxidase domain-containing protein [Ilumatobacteraceae bacterium]